MTNGIWLAENAQEKIDELAKCAAEDLFILTDFDRTLTSAYYKDQPSTALVSQLYSRKILPPAYAKRSSVLFEKYFPMETDPSLTLQEKEAAMEEWWRLCYDLLVEAQLKKTEVRYAMEKAEVWLRPKCPQFLKLTHQMGIPIIVLSANVLGWVSIKIFLESKELHFDNVRIISNRLAWDDNNVLVGYIPPIIHSANKNFALVPKKVRDSVANRKQVLLLGDMLEDVMMANGLPDDYRVLKVGFYNAHNEDALQAYKDAYDVVIMGDGTMDWAVNLVQKISQRDS
jgi:5'-nucleotidase